MQTFTLILTLLNTLFLLYKFEYKKQFKIDLERSGVHKTLLGISLWRKKGYNWYNRILYLPIRDSEEIEKKEDIERILTLNEEQRRQKLRTMFSWVKTKEEAKQFYIDYHIIDKKYIRQLLSKFKEEV